MKDTIRVRRQPSASRAGLQPKINGQAVPAAGPAPIPADLLPRPDDEYPSCLALFDRDAGEPVCKIPLTEGELTSSLSEANRLGLTLPDYCAQSIREKLGRQPELNNELYNMERAQRATISLLELLAERGDFQSFLKQADCPEGEFSEGLGCLVRIVKQNLNESSRLANAAIFAPVSKTTPATSEVSE